MNCPCYNLYLVFCPSFGFVCFFPYHLDWNRSTFSDFILCLVEMVVPVSGQLSDSFPQEVREFPWLVRVKNRDIGEESRDR